MKNSILIAFTLIACNWPLTGASQAVKLTEYQAREILKELAELDMRRETGRIDSLTIVDLLKAYHASDSALIYANKSLGFSREINETQQKIENQVRNEWLKERRRRKAVTLGGVALVVLALLL